eukprot:scaffold4182_cov384-Prasinococcus_capsulatus_cf.AAC.6
MQASPRAEEGEVRWTDGATHPFPRATLSGHPAERSGKMRSTDPRGLAGARPPLTRRRGTRPHTASPLPAPPPCSCGAPRPPLRAPDRPWSELAGEESDQARSAGCASGLTGCGRCNVACAGQVRPRRATFATLGHSAGGSLPPGPHGLVRASCRLSESAHSEGGRLRHARDSQKKGAPRGPPLLRHLAAGPPATAVARAGTSGRAPHDQTGRMGLLKPGVAMASTRHVEFEEYPSSIKGRGFRNNSIQTTKYSLLTFLPKSLFEQYRRVANIYFTLVAVLSLPVFSFSPVSPVTTWFPLILVIGFSLAKEAVEDLARRKQDLGINNRERPPIAATKAGVRELSRRGAAVGGNPRGARLRQEKVAGCDRGRHRTRVEEPRVLCGHAAAVLHGQRWPVLSRDVQPGR